MVNKIVKVVILASLTFVLTGCWDYVGLNEITIISGIAIDKNKEKDEYDITFEMISLHESSKSKTVQSKLIESQGKSIFDAVRNAKRRIMNKLYFSNAQVVIVDEEIAKEDGINSIMDWFIRDGEVRETIIFAISKEKTARELLKERTIELSNAAFEMHRIIKSDNMVTASLKDLEAYQIVDIINNCGVSLALPVFNIVKNDGKEVVEAYGIAVFDKDKLIGYLDSSESKSYLFVAGNVDGGIIPIKDSPENIDEKTYNVSLEIAESKTSNSFTYKDNKFTFQIEIKVKVYIAEFNHQGGTLDEKEINMIEKTAEQSVKKSIEKLIKKAKEEYESDIFCFGHLVYIKNPKLWRKVEKDWNKKFVESDINIKTMIEVTNTAYKK